MKFHGIDMRGKFHVQRVSTLPVFESTDKGRLIYVEDEDEFYFGGTTEWKQGGGGSGAVGGGDDLVFYENDQTVTTSYSITINKNAMTTGPVVIADGATVTIPDGSRWIVL